jgi:hypothetical protein
MQQMPLVTPVSKMILKLLISTKVQAFQLDLTFDALNTICQAPGHTPC